MALLGAGDYHEAINALLRLLSVIENASDEKIRRTWFQYPLDHITTMFTGLRENYTHPRETMAAIEIAIHETFKICPLVLIDVTTGRLCDAQERAGMFKSESAFKKLVSETATRTIDRRHILQSVAMHFQWIMFSHTWEGKEPTFLDVNRVGSIDELDKSPLNDKLRRFCETVREDGYRWAWSDTCCIDKSTSAILSQSLISMYTWYAEAAATLVYLADVLSESELGDLTKSRWMTRAWTLQELLASKVIRFYNREWKPYLNDMHTNHKESPSICQELAHHMGISTEAIVSFHPKNLGVRERLRLASTRNATVEEDIAYSLIGMFSSDIRPHYGEGNMALGHLLDEIVTRIGDTTVIAWKGKSSEYNSALPDSLAVYGQTPHCPPPTESSELDTRVEQLRSQLPPEGVLPFYDHIVGLPPAMFLNRCLRLPCIAFSVKQIGVQELGGTEGNLYRASVTLLGRVEFRTADAMPLTQPQNLVFVHPWLRDLGDPDCGFVSDDDPEVDFDDGFVSDDDPEVDPDDWFEPDDEPEVEFDAGSDDMVETEPSASSGNTTNDGSAMSARVDRYTHALRLVARLGRPFNALLLERQSGTNHYKRVAAEDEIILPGVSHEINLKEGIQVRSLEIV